MSATESNKTSEFFELRMRAGYYRAMHARAVAREARLRRELVASCAIAREHKATIKAIALTGSEHPLLG